MTKAEFIKRLEDQFRRMIESVKRRASAEIENTRAGMDAQTFADWLRSEMGKANAEPALKNYRVILKPSQSTPKDAAQSLAGLIEMDAAPDDWQTQWESAAPLLSNFHPEKSEGWKYRRAFADYMAAAKAEARAGIFAAAIDSEKNDKGKPKAQPARVTPEYDFDALFIEGAKDRFLGAAKKAGMIDSAEKWKAGPRRKWLIMAAWYLVFDRKLHAPGILNDYAACKAIAAKFGEKMPYSTFSQNWGIGYNGYLKLDKRDFFLTFKDVFCR